MGIHAFGPRCPKVLARFATRTLGDHARVGRHGPQARGRPRHEHEEEAQADLGGQRRVEEPPERRALLLRGEDRVGGGGGGGRLVCM